MDTPDLDRLTLLERAQLLHDSTLRRHGDILDRHADHMAHLEGLMEQQLQTQATLKDIADHLTQRQDAQDALMQQLRQTLDAIKDMLDRGNGH